MRELTADSGAPTLNTVAPEVVRAEAAQLFGRPEAPEASATWDIEVERYADHERVVYWLDWFSRRARRHFAIYLARLGRYDSMIRSRLAAAGLPQDLVYLAMIESGMNPNAQSRKGAVGIWQFIPGTARRYGLNVDAWVDERRDPFLSTDAAIRFLAELNDRFGSLYLAAAAYNTGPRTIQRGLERADYGALGGDDVYFAMAEGSHLRPETRDYVPKLIAAALLAKEPERWGFAGVERLPPLRYDSILVSYSVGLDVLARLAGTRQGVMEELNPQLYRYVTPPDRSGWVRVPEGSGESVAARLETLPPRARVTVLVHYVAPGETLSRIAGRYGVSVEDLTGANRGVRPRALRRGQRLIIPTAIVSAASRRAGLSRASGPGAASRRPRPAVSAGGGGSTAGVSRSWQVHMVRPGETLSQIAERFHVPLSALLNANRLTRRSTIRPGQAIRIPL